MAESDNKLDPFTVITNVNWRTPHKWTASARVAAGVVGPIGEDVGVSVFVNGFTIDTNFGAIYSVTAYPNPFQIPIDAGPYISVGSWQSLIVRGVNYWFINLVNVSVQQVMVGINPVAKVNATIVSIAEGNNASIRVAGSATGVTSGRPGGDDEQSQFVDEHSSSAITVTGSAVASRTNVTASMS